MTGQDIQSPKTSSCLAPQVIIHLYPSFSVHLPLVSQFQDVSFDCITEVMSHKEQNMNDYTRLRGEDFMGFIQGFIVVIKSALKESEQQ